MHYLYKEKKGKAHSTITFQGKHLGNLPAKRKILSIICNVLLALAASSSSSLWIKPRKKLYFKEQLWQGLIHCLCSGFVRWTIIACVITLAIFCITFLRVYRPKLYRQIESSLRRRGDINQDINLPWIIFYVSLYWPGITGLRHFPLVHCSSLPFSVCLFGLVGALG